MYRNQKTYTFPHRQRCMTRAAQGAILRPARPKHGTSEGYLMVFATPGVRQAAPPERWREHFFGLPLARWGALAGHSWWVTGAGTGFGQAIAVALALSGGHVFLSGRRPDKLAQTGALAASLGAAREHCVAVPCDITDEAQ